MSFYLTIFPTEEFATLLTVYLFKLAFIIPSFSIFVFNHLFIYLLYLQAHVLVMNATK